MNSFDVGDTVYYWSLHPHTNELQMSSGKIERIVVETDITCVFIRNKKMWVDLGSDCIESKYAYKTKEECILATIDKLKGMLDE